MNIAANLVRHVAHEKLESQIKTAQERLDALKAKAESAKSSIEVEAVSTLSPKTKIIQHELRELKKSGGNEWDHAKAILQRKIDDFEKSVKKLESKARTS